MMHYAPIMLLYNTSTSNAATNENTMMQFGRAGGSAQRRWSEQRGAHRGSRLHALKRMVSAFILQRASGEPAMEKGWELTMHLRQLTTHT